MALFHRADDKDVCRREASRGIGENPALTLYELFSERLKRAHALRYNVNPFAIIRNREA